MFEIYNLGHVTWPYLVSEHSKKSQILIKNSHNFGHSASNSIKSTFLDIALINTFRIIYYLFGFEEVRILLFFYSDVIMNSFAIQRILVRLSSF